MIFEWPLKSALVILAMTIDNYFWITDSPEWKSISGNFKLLKIKSFNLTIPINKEGLKYVFFKRCIPVWTSWRDLIPATITGGLLSLIT
jgi:hypothetical protein